MTCSGKVTCPESIFIGTSFRSWSALVRVGGTSDGVGVGTTGREGGRGSGQRWACGDMTCGSDKDYSLTHHHYRQYPCPCCSHQSNLF